MTTLKRFFVTAGVTAGLIVGLVGCGSQPVDEVTAPVASPVETVAPVESPAPVETTEPTAEPVNPAAENSTLDMLNELVVAEEKDSGYDRELFKHWTTTASGCDTRDAVLIREVVDGGNVSGCNVSGTWVSLYDNKSTTDPGSFDIDHMVPLKEAWGSGAWNWDSATREAYANDMDYAYSLIAVTANSNRSKSDQDPTTWMPTVMDGCEYVGRWVGVKHRWELTVDAAEKDKILSVLSWCDGDYILPETPAKATVKEGVTETTPEAPKPSEPATQPGTGDSGTDPQFSTCGEATSNGYGPYVKGTDPEYAWYQDRDGDGSVCE